MNAGLRGALVLLALVAVGCSSKAKVREPTALARIEHPTLKPVKEWSASAGSGAEGRISGLRLRLEPDALFVADVEGRVYAFDPANGKLRWRSKTDARVVSGPGVSGNMVMLGSLDGEVIALQRADGNELWRRSISSEVLGPPAGDGDLVVARSVDGRVFGLSASNGDRLWAFDRVVPNLVLRGVGAPLLEGNRVVLGMDNGRVASLRLADGETLWEQAVSVPTGRTELERLTDVDADLVEGPKCIYAASFGGDVACVDAENGQVLWRRTIKSYTGMALLEDKLFVTDESGVIWALDAETGAAAWKQEALLYRKLSAPAAFAGKIVVGDFEGYLHWIDPNDGKIIARVRAGSEPILTQPVAGENLLYVLNAEGRITALSTASIN
jgi:outer membrane protein assembly factor BamB